MAHTMTESEQSRVGSHVSRFGAQYITLWILTIDPDEISGEFSDLDILGVAKGFVPPNTTYGPLNNIYATASDYTFAARINAYVFHIQIIFTTPDVAQPLNTGWVMTFTDSTVIKTREIDYNNRRIGTPVFLRDPTGTFKTKFNKKVTRNNIEQIEEEEIILKLSNQTNSEGAEVELPGIGVEFSKLTTQFSSNQVAFVRRFIKRVNENSFLGGPPGTVYLQSFRGFPVGITEELIPPLTPGTRNIGIRQPKRTSRVSSLPTVIEPRHYRLSLFFISSDEPFSPIRRYLTYRDQDGNESDILDAEGNVAFASFDVIEKVNFLRLFEEL